MSETPLQSDKKTDENKKQKESENKPKNTANAEDNEAQNQILNTSNLINSESVSNAKDNKIDENTDKVGYKENTITNNEIPLKNVEKSDQSISEIQKLQSENNDARYYSLKICYSC